MAAGNGDTGKGDTGKRRIACIVQYDGTNYNGWQIQRNGRTIQGVIEESLFTLTREKVRVVASGRTDTGVHAIGQVIHFDLASSIRLEKICIGLNGILPHDISIKNAFHTESTFHSRFSAVEREYRYYIYNYPQRSPFMRYRAMWVHDPLNVDYIREVASQLVGVHDFSSFCKKRESYSKNTVRKLNRIEVKNIEHYIEILFKGNAFLHNMIRIIIGTILQMHKTNEDPSLIRHIIERRDRDVSGKTAPPYGLYLYEVTYDPPLTAMESAF